MGRPNYWYFNSISGSTMNLPGSISEWLGGVTISSYNSGTTAMMDDPVSVRWENDPPEPKIIYRDRIEYVYVPTTESVETGTTIYVNQPQGGNEMFSLTSVSSILIIMVVCIVTVKFILPRITYGHFFRAIFSLIYKPGKKQIKTILAEWRKAKTSK